MRGLTSTDSLVFDFDIGKKVVDREAGRADSDVRWAAAAGRRGCGRIKAAAAGGKVTSEEGPLF